MSFLRASRVGRLASAAFLSAIAVSSGAATSAESNAVSLPDTSFLTGGDGRRLPECPCDSQISDATKLYLCTDNKSVYCDLICANGGGGLWCNACGIGGCRFCKFDCNDGEFADPATECILCPADAIDYCNPTQPTQPPSPAATPMPTTVVATAMPTTVTTTAMPTMVTATAMPTTVSATAMPTMGTATAMPTTVSATAMPTTGTATAMPTTGTATAMPTTVTATAMPTPAAEKPERTPKPSTPGGMGNDPHVWGFRGQSFYFNGKDRDSFYALIHDLAVSINARTAPRYADSAALPYSDLVSLGISTRTPGGGSGAVPHDIGIFSAPDACHGEVADCEIPRHGIQVVLDGEKLPLGMHSVDSGLEIAVMQVPHICKRDRDVDDRDRGMYDEDGGESRPLPLVSRRRLMATTGQRKTDSSPRSASGFDVAEWLASGPIAGAPSKYNDFTNECAAWLEQGRDLFLPRLDGLLTTIMIKTPELTMRIEHWGFDVDEGEEAIAAGALPLMLNLYLDGWEPSHTAHGILGQTIREAKAGSPAIEGRERDYITSGPFATSFAFYP